MPSYTVNAINVGSFPLGESDKVLTIFCAERGSLRAVAKGARKPGSKLSGNTDLLCANKLLLASGKTFEIITQAQCIESFPEFRRDLTRMSYALYYAELTQHFGQGLSEESQFYFAYLLQALRLQARCPCDAAWLCLEFEMGLLDALGYRPELTCCVGCRAVLADYNLGKFNHELGGILCQSCLLADRRLVVAESRAAGGEIKSGSRGQNAAHITPLVWKSLVLAAERRASAQEYADAGANAAAALVKLPLQQSIHAARRLLQGYVENLSGRAFKALDLLAQLNLP